MSQSRRHSLLESIANQLIGFVTAFTAGMFIYPLLGWHVSPSANATSTSVALFTVVSFIRSYFVRRMFNRLAERAAARST
jgi:hypothetical protein